MTKTDHITVIETTLGAVRLSISEFGSGHPILLLHGGGGPVTVTAFAKLLAQKEHAHVYVPIHPGFDGTERPETLCTITTLARLYIALLDTLDLDDVTVVGNSIGGWIAAEMAVHTSRRVSSVILIDAVGAQVSGHPVVDFFGLTFPEIAARTYFEPERYLVDPGAMTEQQRAGLASNRATLGVYTFTGMEDRTLIERLSTVRIPARVIWGAADQIADTEYGLAMAQAIPGAEFIVLPRAGHLPQLETPDDLLTPVWEFADRSARNKPA